MKDLPQQRLNPKVKNVWRLNDGGWITIVFLAVFVSLYLISSDPTSGLNATFPLQCSVVVYILLMIIWVVILPPIRYARWHYELNEDFLDIEKGIIWHERSVIPFIRVQNTDTRQGPLLRLFNLMSVTVSTAAGRHEIPGLDIATAEALRDKAAELARLAREDV
jgi:membrane protein YdbS with pleckstrin-like domain